MVDSIRAFLKSADGEFTTVVYKDNSAVVIPTRDYNRAFFTIINSSKEQVKNEFGVSENLS